MDISIFQVSGPIMIGPSSSHTAGAAKLARISRIILGKEFTHVSFGLHGSFGKTYKGHGTDIALLAGAMGLFEDDENLSMSFEIAQKAGIGFDFYEIDLDDMHENSVKITFTTVEGKKVDIIGSSIGGGQIVIKRINGFDTDFNAESPTIIISQKDTKGVISDVSRVLYEGNINIAIMKVSRNAKGETARCIIETDGFISDDVVEKIMSLSTVLSVQAINVQG